MYKFLLCVRYLRTKYIALASIISVMLGVATMIVVNAVMDGFSTEMEDRLHGIISDVDFGSRSLDGMRDSEWHMEQIRLVAGDSIQSMTPTVSVPAMLSFQSGGNTINRQVHVIGIDEKTQSSVSDFGKYLQHEGNRMQMSFALRADGYDTRDHQGGPDALERKQLEDAGWVHRKRMAEAKAFHDRLMDPPQIQETPLPIQETPPVGPQARIEPPVFNDPSVSAEPSVSPEPSTVDLQITTESQRTLAPPEPTPEMLEELPDPPKSISRQTRRPGASRDPNLRVLQHQDSPRLMESSEAYSESGLQLPELIRPQSYETDVAAETSNGPSAPRSDPFAAHTQQAQFDPALQQRPGLVLGIALSSHRRPSGEEFFSVLPGDDVTLTFPNTGQPLKIVYHDFTVVDFYESKMSEYDSTFVFVPIDKLQQLRGMYDETGVPSVNSIQIKLRPGADGNEIRDKLRAAFPPELYVVQTWRDKQGALLAAVQMETAILNILLFLIIAVAGFGILAIFLMIVVEKTRDIGILKSLGASRSGIMGIFIGYGMSLGVVGSGVGLVLGLLFVKYINQIAGWLGEITGRPVFDPSIYYFYEIPTIVDPWTVTWIVVGAMTIAVLASVLPAIRAALLHPVEALRYE